MHDAGPACRKPIKPWRCPRFFSKHDIHLQRPAGQKKLDDPRFAIMVNSTSTNEWTLPFASQGMLSAGTLSSGEDCRVIRSHQPGLRVVVLLEGQLQYRSENSTLMVNGPKFGFALSKSEYTTDQVISGKTSLEFVSVDLDPSLLGEEMMIDLYGRLPAGLTGSLDDQPIMNLWEADTLTVCLARHILNSPADGQCAARNLFVLGKAIELCAMACAKAIPGQIKPSTTLTAKELLRLHEAKAYLLEQSRQPPSLSDLGRLAAMNTKKLTQGFREVFGASAYEILKEHRLLLAYKLLSTGNYSVSETACEIGYSLSHFIVLFQKRFGILPGALL